MNSYQRGHAMRIASARVDLDLSFLTIFNPRIGKCVCNEIKYGKDMVTLVRRYLTRLMTSDQSPSSSQEDWLKDWRVVIENVTWSQLLEQACVCTESNTLKWIAVSLELYSTVFQAVVNAQDEFWTRVIQKHTFSLSRSRLSKFGSQDM